MVATIPVKIVTCQFNTQLTLNPSVQHVGYGKGIRTKIIWGYQSYITQHRFVQRSLCRCNQRHR